MIKGKLLTDNVIEMKPLIQFIEDIDGGLIIESVIWESWNKSKWKRLHIPEYLGGAKGGMKRVRECTSRILADGVFKNISRKKMKDKINRISKHYGLPLENFEIRSVVLTNGKDKATFTKRVKEMRLPADKRKKVKVLGCLKDNDEIFARLNIRKMACAVEIKPVRRRTCRYVL